MRPLHYLPLLGMTAALLASPAAHAQAPVPQVQVWSLEKTGALGSAIYLQDFAAARATDALLAHLDNKTPEGLVGWIVVPQGEQNLVRFLTGDTSAPTAAYDILVDARGRAGNVNPAADPVLPPEQLAQFAARMTAGTSFSSTDLRCAARYNAVVLDDPDSDGWLVWLLASTTKPDVIPMGGHYRFHISADGKTLLKREMLSAACLDLSKDIPAEARSVGLVTSIVVAPQPLEIHVFQSLNARMPLYAIAGGRIWSVQGARITDAGPAPAPRSR